MNDELQRHAELSVTRDIAEGDAFATSADWQPLVPGYELGELVGRGGMGDVYRARDVEMDREVAVKILQERYPVDSSTGARFVEEARITGQLQHPGIPAVYRVSKLPDGRPFLAMKLIKGLTLDEMLKDDAPVNHLAVMEAVAQAVGYAHAHGVIHRDLKPQNIMVGAFGEVQVMDWGLSKVLAPKGGRKRSEQNHESTKTAPLIRTERDSDYTQAGSVLGTPAYMPPEQAAGEIDRVGKSSDVFGLGAVWCKLLTGEAPFTGADAESVRRKAMRGDTEAALTRLDRCGAERGVIDLCKRCLAVEPDQRPSDANFVAAAIAELRVDAEERARQAELSRARAEVQAAEHSKRRRVVQQAAIAVASVLLVGLAGTAVGLWKADIARQAAQTAEKDANEKRLSAEAAEKREAKQREIAVSEAELANGVRQFLEQDVLLLADPTTQKQEGKAFKYDADVRLRDVLLRAAEKIESKFTDRPLVEAQIRFTLARSLQGIGRNDLALKQLKRVHEIRRERLGPDAPDTLASLHNLANSYQDLDRHAEALELREKTRALMTAKHGRDHSDTIASTVNLAVSCYVFGRYAEAARLLEETLAIQKSKLGAEHPDALAIMIPLANSYSALGRRADALKLREQTQSLMTAKLGRDHPKTLASNTNLALSYLEMGRNADAVKLMEETVSLQRGKLGDDHPDTLDSMNNLANGYHGLGRIADATKVREELMTRRKAVYGSNHAATLESMNAVAYSYFSQGRHAESLKLYEDVVSRRNAALGPNHPKTLTSKANLAVSYRYVGRDADALRLDEETLSALRVVLGPKRAETLKSMNAVANGYNQLGRYEDARKLHEETLTLRKEALGPDHPNTLESMSNLAFTYSELGRSADAIALYEETSRLMKLKLGPDHLHSVVTETNLIAALAEQRPADALARIDAFVASADRASSKGNRTPAAYIPQVFSTRLQIHRKANDAGACRATAEQWEKRNPKSADELYNAARYRAIAATVESKSGAANSKRADEDAKRAIHWLHKAKAAGYNNRSHLEKDADLDALRSHEEFKKLVESMPKRIGK